jgi:hypothetical protein
MLRTARMAVGQAREAGRRRLAMVTRYEMRRVVIHIPRQSWPGRALRCGRDADRRRNRGSRAALSAPLPRVRRAVVRSRCWADTFTTGGPALGWRFK